MFWVEGRHLETLEVNKNFLSFEIDFETKQLCSVGLGIIRCVGDQTAIICKLLSAFLIIGSIFQGDFFAAILKSNLLLLD